MIVVGGSAFLDAVVGPGARGPAAQRIDLTLQAFDLLPEEPNLIHHGKRCHATQSRGAGFPSTENHNRRTDDGHDNGQSAK